RLMGPVDNLFLFDYAIESREKFNLWFSGVKNKISLTLKYMTPLQATSTLGNILVYEMIKAKCKVEEEKTQHSQNNKKMAIKNDLRTMFHFRVVDAAFLKIILYTMLTNDEMDVIGFATMLHDLVDFGYDISVKESSNILLTVTNDKIDIESVKNEYIRMANGLQYIIEKYKHDACSSTEYQHEYLELKGLLLDILENDNFDKKEIKDTKEF
ncbi:1349_t:CDS:2, partial [Cetraspora pellucida]